MSKTGTNTTRVSTSTTTRSSQDFYKELRDDLLFDFEQDFEYLQEVHHDSTDWEELFGDKYPYFEFQKTKRQYIEYLIACGVGSALGSKTSPPLNVDALWHSHLLETEKL